MKNIMLSIDFSKQTYNAALYAAALASHTKTRLILFHAYDPVVSNEDEELNEEVEDSERKVQDKLDALAQELRNFSNISITRLLKPGNAVDGTLYVAKKIKADLIIWGIENSNQLYPDLDEVTQEILKKATLPVLLVPSKATFKPYKVVQLLTEAGEAGQDFNHIKFLEKLFYRFQPVQLVTNPKVEEKAAAENSVGLMQGSSEAVAEDILPEQTEISQAQQAQLYVKVYTSSVEMEEKIRGSAYPVSESKPLLFLHS